LLKKIQPREPWLGEPQKIRQKAFKKKLAAFLGDLKIGLPHAAGLKKEKWIPVGTPIWHNQILDGGCPRVKARRL
jgi:hypothetical protein